MNEAPDPRFDGLALLSILLNYGVDVERAKNGTGSVVIKNDNAITAGGDVSVIDRGDWIFVTVRRPH